MSIYLKKYWREIVIILALIFMYSNLQYNIKKAIDYSDEAADYAVDASKYARLAYDSAEDASKNAEYCAYNR